MLNIIAARYLNNFRGFSREIWILTIITFINRAGTMVLPFLSKYLKEALHFSYSEVGWIMVCFGLGSMVGSFMGGKLSDTIGFYKVMVFSLFTSGLIFFVLQFITSFVGLCMGMFCIMAIADMFRPAMFVSIGAYAKPENRTRAMTLVRLSINLGFAAGPALGGLLIMTLGYQSLFWVDGLSCIVAIVVFALLVKEKKDSVYQDKKEPGDILVNSVFKDKPFWIFLFCSFSIAVTFFQLFTTLPLYHHIRYELSEFQTGLLMTLNGLLIFIFEMPLVAILERRKISKIKIILTGALFMAMSYIILLIEGWAAILIVSMLFVTIGEMLAFPFSNSWVMNRAPKGHTGRYMALYTMSFSLAHIVSAKAGMDIIAATGYPINWLAMAILATMAAIACGLLLKRGIY